MLELNRLQVFSNVTQLIADLFMKCDLNVVQSSCSLIPVKGAISFLTSVGGESFDSKHDQKKTSNSRVASHQFVTLQDLSKFSFPS
jgi:hypothetical protein